MPQVFLLKANQTAVGTPHLGQAVDVGRSPLRAATPDAGPVRLAHCIDHGDRRLASALMESALVEGHAQQAAEAPQAVPVSQATEKLHHAEFPVGLSSCEKTHIAVWLGLGCVRIAATTPH